MAYTSGGTNGQAHENEKVDIFICGSGSAGLSAATWLARYGVRCKIVDSRSGPLEWGVADGIQSRTTEIFESFGIEDQLLREGFHNLEVVFYNPVGKEGAIERTRSVEASYQGLSHLPRLILSQARVHDMLLGAMKRFNDQDVDYGYRVQSVKVDEEKGKDPHGYPVTIVTEKDGKEETFEAKFALGCDGAHSTVRKSLGFKLVGDGSDSVWGVMDFIPRTDFPDTRKLTVIQSKVGSVLNIPREGGSMNRFYMELPEGTVAKEVKLEDLQETTRRIFHPYQIDFAETVWWSTYTVGQRVADRFTHSDRVFLTGDACHTHSPKAGQGMNVSFQDGYNIGWKLATFLKGEAKRDILETYTTERQKVAEDLIEWDKNWVKSIASKGKDQGGVLDANNNVDFSEIWVKARPFTAGLTIKYDDSVLTRANGSLQSRAKGLKVGMRFPSAQVIRFCDAFELQFLKAFPSDGRWRIVIFAGDVRQIAASRRLIQLGKYLFSEHGPIKKYTAPGLDVDSFIEVLVLLSGERLTTKQEQIPKTFWPETGKWRVRDLHKIYIDDESYHSGHGHAYEVYGVNPKHGATAIVRPDGYVSMVLDIEDYAGISDFFAGFAVERISAVQTVA
ncbi:putative phenol 2-monooxygenase [Mollisia scopiformis]|uniref:Putative phenol 2-monooxygenase n=1 Tax=Mollisia scopiformis TaxID=149040 RepID=A0A132B2M3_MOLSC|nr:putative phenol 2-monooxygenase [Mollisia scopiformis]KUJ06289.1 putative phenol 2-monooxygenase [Mollisia scopiformis]